MKKLLSVILCALILCPTFISCSEGAAETEKGSAENNGVSAENSAVEETEGGRASVKDNLPEGLTFDGSEINFYTFGRQTVQDYDCIGEMGGDVVLDAVYNRNLTVEERLDIKLNWIAGSDDWNGFPDEVLLALQAATGDYDVIMEESSRLWQQSIKGYYFDMKGMDYIDLEQPWWYSDMMEESNLDNTKRYFLNGDICLTVLFGASAMYVNKGMYNDYLGDINALYNMVVEGKWTYDEFMNMCRTVYTDKNGDGINDPDDIMGFRYEQWGIPNYMSMSNGLNYITRDEEGFPVLNINSELGIKWGETLYKLLYTDNMAAEGDKLETFRSGTSLFLPGLFETAHDLRDVDFEYGIVPYPKLDETLEYVSGAATANGCGVAVPVSVNAEKLGAICASLEALSAEAYRKVTPAWYETALKVKYSAGLIDAQMVDIIYEHINCPFIMMADKELDLGSIFTRAVYGSNNDGAFASYYRSQKKLYEKKLSTAIEDYKKIAQ